MSEVKRYSRAPMYLDREGMEITEEGDYVLYDDYKNSMENDTGSLSATIPNYVGRAVEYGHGHPKHAGEFMGLGIDSTVDGVPAMPHSTAIIKNSDGFMVSVSIECVRFI